MYGKSDVGSQCTNKLCSPNGSPRGSLCLTVKRSGFINARYPSRPLGQKLEVVAGVEMTLELFRRLADLLPAPLCCGMRRSWGRAWSGWCCCREGTLGHTLPHPATPCHTLPYCATPCHTVPHHTQQSPPGEEPAPALPFAAGAKGSVHAGGAVEMSLPIALSAQPSVTDTSLLYAEKCVSFCLLSLWPLRCF